MKDAQRALLFDNSLSDGARVIGLLLMDMPIGDWHEVPHSDFARVLNGYPSSDTIRRYVRQLEMAGYLDVEAGGRGHAQRYRIKDRTTADVNTDRSASVPRLKLIDVGDDDDVNPPISPLGDLLDPKALEVIQKNEERLKGCRDSLKDYLKARVPLDRQWAYVQAIVGWLDGILPGIWTRYDGTNIPPPLQTKLLAAALNDLAASDERIMKRPVGDIANLQTKMGILLRRREDGGSGKTYNRATGTEGRSTPDQSTRRRRGYGDD